jgi:N-acetyldiaminopimelate deacetylase
MISPTELRKWMHSNPEPAFRENKITHLLQQELSSIHSVKVFQPLETGLLVFYEGLKSFPCTLLRADIDALPMSTDNTTVIKASHLCGHDVHTAILWGILQKVINTMPKKNILFLFQPGEESGDGAKQVLHTKILNQWSILNCLALHVHDKYPIGSIASNDTTLFAASQEIDILFQGKQGHITCPEKGIDAWKACIRFNSLWNQQEEKNDSFLGIGRVVAGVTRNSIPAEARMYITTRARTIEKLEEVLGKIQYIVHTIENDHGVKGTILKGSHCPPVQNHHELFTKSCDILQEKFPILHADMIWAAEDFGYFSANYPSFMFWLGTREQNSLEVGLHHTDFYPSDKTIQYGIQAFSLLLDLQKNTSFKTY